MATDPYITNYLGPRHAPKADFAAPTEDPGAGPVGRISVTRTSVNGTGSLLSQPRVRKPHGASFGGQTGGIESPLDTSNLADIIAQSGLGRRQPAGKSWAESASDADQPTQTVSTDDEGNAVHTRANGDGSVTQRPLGAYDGNLARKVFGLQASSSDPDFFGEGA